MRHADAWYLLACAMGQVCSLATDGEGRAKKRGAR